MCILCSWAYHHDSFIMINELGGPWFSIKILSYQYSEPYCGDMMVIKLSYLHNEISYTGKISSFILNQGPGSLLSHQIPFEDRLTLHSINYTLTMIPAWARNHMSNKVWEEITYPFPNFNGATFEVWELIDNPTLLNGCNYLSIMGLS